MKPTRVETEDGVLWDAHSFWNGNTEKRSDQAHWLGYGRWKESAWKRHGLGYLEKFREMWRRFGKDGSRSRLLDWGCGGGANVVAFSEDFDEIVGVDISPDSLRNCQMAVQKILPDGDIFRPFPIAVDDPFSARALTRGADLFDAVLCTEVVQHMPSARYAHDVMELWASLARPGALALVQFRTHFHSRPAHRSGRLRYHENVARWLMLNPEAFSGMATHAGWDVVGMQGLSPQRRDGYVDAYLRRR